MEKAQCFGTYDAADLYLPALPLAVAQLCLQCNPGVQAVDHELTRWRWSPWVCATRALLCVAITAGILKWQFSGLGVPMPPLIALRALIGAAMTLAYLHVCSHLKAPPMRRCAACLPDVRHGQPSTEG
ncbi:hypothetical protein [Micromonospora sp. NPDC049204]|uniref:hypothetical protein n=1 Tax=Micromonospora sp. NPDC049204 TaxID=3154351 RepID=UPI0033FD70D7